jgi:ketosteroid isomerase-like protein
MLEQLINSWHDAVNGRDLRAAQALVTDPVEVSGPRGASSVPAQAFAHWIIESGIRLRPLSTHPVDDVTVVVEQDATWPDNPDTEAAATPPTAVATLFKVRDGAISTIRRFESLHEALRAASNETPRP